MRTPRVFPISQASRGSTRVLLGLFGPSGSGKTTSALTLATGLVDVEQRGHITVIDTEGRRALHYAGDYAFRHLDMTPPFGSLDYLDAIQQAVSDGARVVVLDSASHEHEGEGGVLESHDEEVERRARGDERRAKAVSMQAWIKPKSEHNKLVNALQQLDCHFLLCYRAKRKLDLRRGVPEDERDMGWWPVGGERMVFEMLANILLLPADPGMPVYQTDNPKQRDALKCAFLTRRQGSPFASGQRITAEHGRWLARWCRGDADGPLSSEEFAALVESIDVVVTASDLGAVRARALALRTRMSVEQTAAIREALGRALSRAQGVNNVEG